MRYNINSYKLIIESIVRGDECCVEKLKCGTDIIYNFPGKFNMNGNGTYADPYKVGSIEFELENNSDSIRFLLEIEGTPVDVKIIDFDGNVKLKGRADIINKYNDTCWVINEFHKI